MVSYFQGLVSAPLTIGDFILNVAVACICGILHISFYRAVYRGPGYSVSFLNSLVLLSMITAVVIMVIGDSLARAFGLVGAMSIIRFRTAVKEVLDIVHIFLALAIGMTAGAGLHAAAVAGVVTVGLIAALLTRLNVTGSPRDQYVVNFAYQTPDWEVNGQEPAYLAGLRAHCRKAKLVNVRSGEGEEEVEVSYYVQPKQRNSIDGLLKELRALDGVRSVAVFSDEEQF